MTFRKGKGGFKALRLGTYSVNVNSHFKGIASFNKQGVLKVPEHLNKF